jgi:hypothetical protein
MLNSNSNNPSLHKNCGGAVFLCRRFFFENVILPQKDRFYATIRDFPIEEVKDNRQFISHDRCINNACGDPSTAVVGMDWLY